MPTAERVYEVVRRRTTSLLEIAKLSRQSASLHPPPDKQCHDDREPQQVANGEFRDCGLLKKLMADSTSTTLSTAPTNPPPPECVTAKAIPAATALITRLRRLLRNLMRTSAPSSTNSGRSPIASKQLSVCTSDEG